LGSHRARKHRASPVSAALQKKTAELTARSVDPAKAWETAQRKHEPTPAQVDTSIASEIESLKARAVAPVVEHVDEELAAREEDERREARRADNLRRLGNPVLTQRTESGAIIFKSDRGIVNDGRIADRST